MQNPLESYRRTQRELRRNFETFTRANCPTCPTPCCRRPARIAPTDILLAEATGWRATLPIISPTSLTSPTSPDNAPSAANAEQKPIVNLDIENADMVTTAATRMLDALGAADEMTDAAQTGEGLPDDLPCEYLGATGCTFPLDLRPFGCTTYICKYMYARLDRPTLTRIKRLVRELEDKHIVLMRTVGKARRKEEG